MSEQPTSAPVMRAVARGWFVARRRDNEIDFLRYVEELECGHRVVWCPDLDLPASPDGVRACHICERIKTS